MKMRLLSLVLCLCLCGTLFACGKDDVIFEVRNYTAAARETVTVEIHVSENSNVAAADLELSFDPAALTYVSFKAGESFQQGVGDASLAGDGLVKVCLATLTPPQDACAIASLTFTVNEGAKGEYPLTLACTTCCDYDTNPITASCVNGSILIEN
jgi:hypothetical protein